MNINIQRLTIEGYRSIAFLDFDFDDFQGINLFRGANGTGKTTVPDALFWCLYGKNLKNTNLSKIPTWKQHRSVDFSGTRVIVQLQVDNEIYFIARHYKWERTTFGVNASNDLMIFNHEKKLISETHKNTTQQAVIELLGGINSEVFLNTVVFGQRLMRFIDAPKSQKVEVFEQLFRSNFVDELKEQAEVQFNELVETREDITTSLRVLDKSIEVTQNKYDELEKLIVDFETNIKQDIENYEHDLQKVSTSIAKAETQKNKDDLRVATIKDEISQLRDKRLELSAERIATKNRISNYENELSRFNSLEGLKCEYCDLDYSEVISIEDMTKRNKKEIDYNYEKVVNIENEVRDINETIEKLDSELEVYKTSSNSLVSMYTHQREIRNQLKELRSRKVDRSSLDDTLGELNRYKSQVSNLNKHLNEVDQSLEMYRWWIGKAFSVNGIKSYVLRTMLNELNRTALKYSVPLGVNVHFTVDVSKKRKDFNITVTLNGYKRDYEELSGGQQARVDVILALSMHEMLTRYQSKFNVLFMDEFFENIDEEGLYRTFDLLREKSRHVKVFIITHQLQIDSSGVRKVNFDIINGLTQVEI